MRKAVAASDACEQTNNERKDFMAESLLNWSVIVPVLVSIAAGAGGVLATTFVLKPYMKYRKILHDISYVLIFSTGVIVWMKYSAEPEESKKVSKKFRSLAVKLRLSRNTTLQELDFMPSDKDLKEASGRMFRIANRMYEDKKPDEEIISDIKEIGRLLRIDIGNWT